MAIPVNLPEIMALSIDERIELAQAIWDSIADETDEADPPELSDDLKRLLDRRIADLDANPENVVTWEEVKARILE